MTLKGISPLALLVVLVLEAVSLAGRGWLNRYAHRIGVADPAFSSDPAYARQRRLYTFLDILYLFYSFAVGILVVVVGMITMVNGLQPPISWLQTIMGTLIELVGVGVMAQSLLGRPRKKDTRPPAPARSGPSPRLSPDGEPNILTDIVGARSEKQPMSRFYNIRSYIVWGVILLTTLIYLLFFAPIYIPQ